MDGRERQHQAHRQMERCRADGTAESRLHIRQDRPSGERPRQAGQPCDDIHQVQQGKRAPFPLRHRPGQRAGNSPVQRKPHPSGREQRGKDQRGDQACQRTAEAGADGPGRCKAAGTAATGTETEQIRQSEVMTNHH